MARYTTRSDQAGILTQNKDCTKQITIFAIKEAMIGWASSDNWEAPVFMAKQVCRPFL